VAVKPFLPDGFKTVVQKRDTLFDFGDVAIRPLNGNEGTTEPITGTRTTYDAAGRVTKTEQLRGLDVGLANSSTFVRAGGTVVSTTRTEYDNAGRVLTTTDAYGLKTFTRYNDFGEVIETRTESVRDTATGSEVVELVTRTVYDAQGRVILTTDQYADGVTSVLATKTVYDTQGRAYRTIRLTGVRVDIGVRSANRIFIFG